VGNPRYDGVSGEGQDNTKKTAEEDAAGSLLVELENISLKSQTTEKKEVEAIVADLKKFETKQQAAENFVRLFSGFEQNALQELRGILSSSPNLADEYTAIKRCLLQIGYHLEVSVFKHRDVFVGARKITTQFVGVNDRPTITIDFYGNRQEPALGPTGLIDAALRNGIIYLLSWVKDRVWDSFEREEIDGL